VWKKGYFAWEYKGRHKDLQAADLQLDQYRADLENPPLLVTCDMGRIVVSTNFTCEIRVNATDREASKTGCLPAELPLWSAFGGEDAESLFELSKLRRV